MSDRLSDDLALTLTALIVEVMAGNGDDPRVPPPWTLLETTPAT